MRTTTDGLVQEMRKQQQAHAELQAQQMAQMQQMQETQVQMTNTLAQLSQTLTNPGDDAASPSRPRRNGAGEV